MTLHILNRSASRLAPEGLFFEARVSGMGVDQDLRPDAYDPSFHDLRYRWTITRNSSPAGARQSPRLPNLPLAHNDTNTAYGKRVGHVFTEPGSYTVTCEVRNDDGLEARASLPVAIGDPDLFFQGARTILVDPDGRRDPAYDQAQITRDLASAFDLATRVGAATRVLLARGKVHQGQNLRLDQGHRDGLWLGAYGDGPAPVLAARGDRDPVILVRSRFDGELRVSGITFQGFWDSTTETGPRADCIAHHARESPFYTVITDCDFSGWSITVFCAQDANNVGLPIATYLHDCAITNWGDYGLLQPDGPGSFLSVTATAIAQHPEAHMGGPKDALHNHHGPMRLGWPGRVYIGACDMFSRTGWSPNAGYPSEQPCIRWNTSMRPGTSGVIERMAMEGGEVNLSLTNAGVPPNHYLTNLVVEKCLMVGNATTHHHVLTHTNGLTLRNVLAIKPNAPRVTSPWHAFLRYDHRDGFVFVDTNAPIRAYSNTVVTLLDEINREGRDLGVVVDLEAFEVFGDENNVLIAPNTSHALSEETGRAPVPIETVTGVWRPRYLGVRHRPSRVTEGRSQLAMDDTYATPQDGAVALYIPSIGSALHESAMGTVAIDDFFGRIRPALSSRGAFEPDR